MNLEIHVQIWLWLSQSIFGQTDLDFKILYRIWMNWNRLRQNNIDLDKLIWIAGYAWIQTIRFGLGILIWVWWINLIWLNRQLDLDSYWAACCGDYTAWFGLSSLQWGLHSLFWIEQLTVGIKQLGLYWAACCGDFTAWVGLRGLIFIDRLAVGITQLGLDWAACCGDYTAWVGLSCLLWGLHSLVWIEQLAVGIT